MDCIMIVMEEGDIHNQYVCSHCDESNMGRRVMSSTTCTYWSQHV